ncbi:nucleoside recognition domain-containing protein [Jeotgalibacillus salarius]|uniref:Nucleoside transporter/FeoB GTPase Gate domain-containing protein n=1 Tax=Jeotgalibacillus salarius TaxID=546023 RepID=A0A4Y8LFB6_9BACL|nr:nucleoside recognition domain-containing protein [Jeotgalibacillus salarius]TFE00253.1 hypothetical protein E2626_12275 [Jeotgalibacillus salarius]
MKLKDHIISLLFFLSFIFLLVNPESTIEAAINGMQLFIEIIFPSLFPFFVLTSMLPSISWLNNFSKFFGHVMKPVFNVSGQGALVFLTGSLSGFPVGAKMTADMLKKNKISLPDAQRLICYTNGASPMFLIGAVAGGLMNQPSLGIILFLCHLAGNMIIGIFAGRLIKGDSLVKVPERNESVDYITLFRESVVISMKQLVVIGGFIIFFSVAIHSIENGIQSLHSDIPNEKLEILASGILELSNGVDAAVRQSENLQTTAMIVLAMVSFSGLCIHMQVVSFIDHLPISYKPYLLSRLFHMILSPLIFIIYTHFSPFAYDEVPAVQHVIMTFSRPVPYSQLITIISFSLCIIVMLVNVNKQKSRL